ncbi:TrmH family RNA methyltransferase [Actinomadura welshii]
MASLVPVTDPADPRISDYMRLRDVNLRKSLEAENGLFLAEGEKVIRRAVGAGHPVRSLLMSRRWAEPLADVLDGVDAPAYVAEDAVLESITGFPVHRGALASLERLPLPTVDAVLTGAHRVIVCEDIVDHTNIGAIFRCAAALGVDAAVLAPRCADPLYRRSVKVSMGAVFALPYARMTDRRNGLSALRRRGFQLLALTPAADAAPIDEVKGADRRALLLGSEGDGLSSRWLHEADHRVRIPMDGTALARGVDSLNVVAAAAIACYALTR